MQAPATLIPVEGENEREAARALIDEYLRAIHAIAQENYGLTFDIEAMVHSDLEDRDKFFPPHGRFYLLRHAGAYVGVGCLKRLAPQAGELQRMYVKPAARGIGAGRLLLQRLIDDARGLGYRSLRLESLKALETAHRMYRSAGFADIDPYVENSMRAYQAEKDLEAFRASTVFMELRL